MGLTGIPPVFSAIHGDLGFLHPEWDGLGELWQEFVWKWLTAETTLAKAGRRIMGAKELLLTDLPAALTQWGAAQITKTEFNADVVTEEFGPEMLKWWDGLGLKQGQGADHLLDLAWCRNGTAGIVMLVLGMRWWADYSGAGKQWTRVLTEMTGMWELISAAPSL
jgi:hypothetical protein